MQKLLIPALVAGVALSLVGCSGGKTNSRIDYKKAETTKPLEVPPDLTLPRSESHDLDLPALSTQGKGAAGGQAILPLESNVHVAGCGSQRWLVVDMSPDELWPKLKSFWPTVGLTLKRDDAPLGIMETDWAENRADISGGSSVKGVLGKLLSSLHSAPTRDKYRLRLERGEGGKSELYVTQYGLEQVVTSKDTEGFVETTWQTRPSDSELSNEILKRLMAYLGTPVEVAAKLPVTETVGPDVKVVDQGGPALSLSEGFDRTWRLSGIALDRMGLVVEDRDRSNGVYYVTKVVDLEDKEKQGWFSSLFSGKKEKQTSAHYRIKIEAQGDNSSLITLQDGEGKRLTSDSARALLERMRGQMQ